EIHQMGMTITGFSVGDFNYPKQVQDMINKSASHGMVGDVSKYQQISVTDAMASGKLHGSGTASDMAGMMMGMTMANKMMDNMNQNNSQDQMKQQNQNQQNQNEPTQSESNKPSEGTNKAPNFCPNCGQKTNGANFCSNCGQKLV